LHSVRSFRSWLISAARAGSGHSIGRLSEVGEPGGPFGGLGQQSRQRAGQFGLHGPSHQEQDELGGLPPGDDGGEQTVRLTVQAWSTVSRV
jgi:hypothetical protein